MAHGSQSQELSQQQQLRQRLTPQQVAFGRMLEMSAPEFEDEVRRELDENPALESIDPEGIDEPQSDFNETSDQLQQADWGESDDAPDWSRPRGSDAPYDYFHNDADDSASRYERLEQQLGLLDINDTDRAIATYIIGNIDSNGYLTRDLQAIADDIAMGAGLDATVDDVRRAMWYVRSLEPAGICATDLRDCLLLQLERLDPARQDVADATAILRDRFDLFSRRRFDKIEATTGMSRERIDKATQVITSLNPKPGSLLESVGTDDRTRHITPDFLVDTLTDGTVTVSLAGRTPELAVDRAFSPETQKSTRGADAAFIKARRDAANDFIDMARRRQTTLMAVMEAIVRLQPDFFTDYDTSRLRPMVLRDVSAITGLDLSVISRATASKYMATPHGVFALKSLFSEGGGSGDTSSHAITAAIRAIIAAEDPAAPLNDAEIGDALAARGIDVARRTVSKYRERAGFPVARLRRR